MISLLLLWHTKIPISNPRGFEQKVELATEIMYSNPRGFRMGGFITTNLREVVTSKLQIARTLITLYSLHT
jgi:hypothetical protein